MTFSRGWRLIPVGELIELNPKNEADDATEVGFVPMPLMATNYLEIVQFETRKWHEVKKGYTHFSNGDVLLAKITPCFENGKSGIANELPNGIGAGSTEYFVCRPKPKLMISKYLLAFFKTEKFLRDGEMRMTGSVGHKRVPKDYLLDAKIALAPLSEQVRISDKLDKILARMAVIRELAGDVPVLRRFSPALFAKAFRGEL
jgi:type I restriction enzyme S subunit